MYTSNFIANSDFLIKYLLQHYVVKDEVDPRQIIYDLAGEVVDTENVICECPRINSRVKNIGKFSLERMLSFINNVRLSRRPVSVNRSESFQTNTKVEYCDLPATNYMIIAKPGIDAYKLAVQMEQQFKCVHIDCDRLIEREIQSKSRLGIWLDKNLQLNKILPIEIILWLIQRETRTNKVIFCGYILTGLPLIPNIDLSVKKNFLTEEDFLMFQQIVDEIVDTPITIRARELAKLKMKLFSEYPNLDDFADELKEDITEEIKSPSQEPRPLPKLFHRISCDQDVRFSIKRQLFFALDLEIKPTILIYIDCDDDDIITKNIVLDNRTPVEIEGIRIALERYNIALDIVQQFVCHYPQSNLIYCHGIYTSEEMLKVCNDKIKDLCNIKHVFFALDFYETFKDDENIIEKLEATSSPHGILDILCNINPIRDDFGWFRSSFENKCPVMTTQGKCVLGKYQYSVQFTGYIYLLSSDENKRIFLENPQIFIRQVPTCRVGVMGPRCSGKSTFARCLSKFFENSTVIDVNYLFDYYRKVDIINLYYAEALEQAIAELNAQHLDKYNEEQLTRQNKTKDWIKLMRQNIIGFLKPIPTKSKGKGKKLKPDKKAVEQNGKLRTVLNMFGFETDDPVILKSYLNSEDMFLNKLPKDLRINVKFREAQASDTDVKKLATEHMDEMSKDYTLSLARKLEILVTKIRLCEKRQKILTKQNKLYGYWILDGVPPDYELFQGLHETDCLPDVIVNMDDSVGERLAENQNIKCRREFYDIPYVVGTIVSRNKIFFKHMMNTIPSHNIESSKFFDAQLVRRELEHILMQDELNGTINFQEENGEYRERFERVKSFLEPLQTHVIFVDLHNTSWTDTIIDGLRDYMNYFNAYPHVLQDDWSTKNETKPSDWVLRIGTTAEYCPVLYVDKMLLKLGVSQYSVQLKNRTYLLSTEEALQKFVKDPFKYSEIERPFRIPPYRLCVIGNYHVARRSDLSRVADILGTKHMVLNNIINLYFDKTQSKRNINISSFYEILEDLGDSLVNDIIAPLFKEGFLLENFPPTAEHLKQMIQLCHYPEQIFYLKIENKHLMKAELKYYMQLYKDQLLIKVNALKLQDNDWMSQRRLRFNELITELPTDFVVEEDESFDDRLEPDMLTDILNAFDVEPDSDREGQIRQLHVADMVNEEMPPDLYTKLIEELMRFPIKQEVKDYMKSRVAEFKKIKSVAEEYLIPFIQIRLHPYTTKEIEKSVLKHIKEGTDRQYIFERAHPISYKNAINYLHYGQFLLSRYFWSCPVRNYNMSYPIKLSINTPDIDKKLQPFIHNEHVYFVRRSYHNVDHFVARPYIYVSPLNACQITKPIQLVADGPRRVGCIDLCRRISKEFQINCFTLDEMKEFVMKNFKWTKLATKLIENDMQITDAQQICDLVKISTNFETQGWILRNVPLDTELMNCFIINSLDINLVIYMDPTGLDLWTNFKNKYNTEKYKRKMEVIEKLYDMIEHLKQFSTHCANFKGLNQNIITIRDFTSRWSTWNKAYREILLLLRLFNLYEMRGTALTAACLYKLDVTDYELNFRLSPLKLYCPLCWLNKKLLIKYRYHYIDNEEAEPLYSDNLYDKNLFQYLKYFYWSCNMHLVELMVNSESYLPTDELLPEELPKLITDWKDYVVTNQGYCPVAYFKSEKREVIIGLPEFSVLYFNKIYVMSCKSYCIRFLQDPNKYKDVQIVFVYSQRSDLNEDFLNMKLDFGTITPTLITNALLECALERPKHYNLDPSQSLEIYLGLYFKCHNSSSSDLNNDVHKSIFLKFWEECKLVQRNINEMQITGNPYILRSKKPRLFRASSSAFGF